MQELEALALAWCGGETVLAATADGIYRSSNAGRAWRLGAGGEGAACAALAYRPDGTALAALEDGGLLTSQDRGAYWSPYGQAPSDVRITALLVTGAGDLLLGTVDQGLLRSTDNGLTWRRAHAGTVLSLAATAGEEIFFAGLSDGVGLSQDGGVTWTRLPTPPLHDLRQILMVGGRPWLWERTAGIVRYATHRG